MVSLVMTNFSLKNVSFILLKHCVIQIRLQYTLPSQVFIMIILELTNLGFKYSFPLIATGLFILPADNLLQPIGCEEPAVTHYTTQCSCGKKQH